MSGSVSSLTVTYNAMFSGYLLGGLLFSEENIGAVDEKQGRENRGDWKEYSLIYGQYVLYKRRINKKIKKNFKHHFYTKQWINMSKNTKHMYVCLVFYFCIILYTVYCFCTILLYTSFVFYIYIFFDF